MVDAPEPIPGTVLGVPSGQRLATADGLGSFVVHYGPTSPFDPSDVVLTGFVPTPAPFVLLAAGGLLTGSRRRREGRTP